MKKPEILERCFFLKRLNSHETLEKKVVSTNDQNSAHQDFVGIMRCIFARASHREGLTRRRRNKKTYTVYIYIYKLIAVYVIIYLIIG